MAKISNSYVNEVQSTMKEINDILAKSGYGMAKAEDEPEEAEMQDSAPEQSFESPEETGDEMASQEAPGEAEMAPEGSEMAPEEGSEDPAAEMKEHISSMSDEELDMMMQMLTEEQAMRQGGEDQGMGMESAPAPAPAPVEKSSHKEDYLKLQKSVSAMNSTVEKLNKEIADLKKAKAKPASKMAPTNSTQVLNKSSRPAQMQRLNKSDTMDFLMQKVRQKDPLVNSSVMAEVNATHSDEELHGVQARLEKLGLQFPKA